MSLKYHSVLSAIFVDSYVFSWKFEDKKGDTPMIVLYDPEDHQVYQMPFDCDVSKIKVGDYYKFKIEAEQKYDKIKRKVIAVGAING